MNIYGLLRNITSVRSARLRLAMLFAAHIAGRRSIGIYLDPVLACNLRCRMCAFSDDGHRKMMKGRMSDDEIDAVARGLMRRALKVQIGCGAEPTLDSRVGRVITLAKEHGVPYVSLTTNGQLLTDDMLESYAEAGLDELTLSLHGTTAATYEWLMAGASFDRFRSAVRIIREVKKRYPSMKLRVNYTVNADNVAELPAVVDLFGSGMIDILQVRPVQRLGNTDYNNFDLTVVADSYDDVFLSLAERCRRESIDCLLPSRVDLAAVGSRRDSRAALFETVTYCYVGPDSCYYGDYDIGLDTYSSFHRRNRTTWCLLCGVLGLSRSGVSENNVTKKLNYRVRRRS